MRYLKVIAVAVFAFVVLLAPAGAAAGPFGPPQPAVRGERGMHTAIGYWFHEDLYLNGTEHVSRQNLVYSELGYGSRTGWEVTARIGMSDLRVADAFGSGTGATTTYKRDFEEHEKFFGSLGAKYYYPFSDRIGLGTFVQGTYYFSDFTDTVSGTRTGIPFLLGLRVKNLWDVNFGMGLQVTIPWDIKIYIGPYLHYSELKVTPTEQVAGLALSSGETKLRNKNVLGGFAGIEVPLAKGFRLNLEGQYTDRYSTGVAVIYVY